MKGEKQSSSSMKKVQKHLSSDIKESKEMISEDKALKKQLKGGKNGQADKKNR